MTSDTAFPVVLSFDIDGEASHLFRDPENTNRPVVMSQGRYGPTVGVPRILDFLDRHEISSTFFVPGWIADQYPDTIREIRDRGHELGHHGYLHEALDTVAPDEEEKILLRGIEAIDRAAGVRPVGYRAPKWITTNATIGLLEKHGFRYASNMMDADAPYRHQLDGRPSSIVELPVEWTLDDTSLYLYSLAIPNSKLTPNTQVLDLWCGAFDGLYESGGSCVMTIHPQITGRPYRMKALETWVNHVKSYPNVQFLRGSELAATVD